MAKEERILMHAFSELAQALNRARFDLSRLP
ncbi:MAG: hypothetical protein RL015_3825 [Verrucomicrobiota bacterium]|jgi:hypothetical protein